MKVQDLMTTEVLTIGPEASLIAEILIQNRDVLEGTLWVEPGRVDVDVVRGAVKLTGRLERSSDAVLLERFAARVPGAPARSRARRVRGRARLARPLRRPRGQRYSHP